MCGYGEKANNLKYAMTLDSITAHHDFIRNHKGTIKTNKAGWRRRGCDSGLYQKIRQKTNEISKMHLRMTVI